MRHFKILQHCLLFSLTLFASNLVAQQVDEVLDTQAMDKSVRIQDDLFGHVNGTWLRDTPIPEDKSNYGSFIKLADLSQARIRKIIDSVSESQHPEGTDEQKIADFYRSFMDEARVNELGVKPAMGEVEAVDELASKEDVVRHFGYLSKIGIGSPIGFFVSQDAGDATQYISQLIQAGTSLPDRDYYLQNDEGSTKAREALVKYIRSLGGLAGIPELAERADAILELETKLAQASWPRVKIRDAQARYNKKSFEELNQLTAGKVNWEAFFDAAGLDQSPASVNVNTPSYFEELAGLLESTPLETWRAYLKFRVLDAAAPYLSQPFVDANFELFRKQLAGIEVQLPRWKQAVDLISGAGGGDFGTLGEAVGQLYVAEHFKPESKQAMETLVENLLTAFGESIDDLSWMTDETKQRAQDKLSKITPKIGYPNKWRDYSQLVVRADDLFGNVRRSNIVEHFRNVNKLGKPIDREEWGMTPQTVNAYYNPSKNEIVFPAAILQPPFFDINAPDPLNYGGIGAVIGHEISHAFDDQGSRYDGDGNLKNWWTEADAKAFQELTSQLVEQYSAYEPLEGKTVDGNLTLGENIADLSGLSIAYKALKIARQGKPEVTLAGWNSDQLFFVGWSRVWQRKYRDKEMVKRLLTDPHSPSRYRANGPVTNIDAFYQAFDVKEGDALYKPVSERIQIW